MLTRLKVDGFKNLVGVDVRFGPFTCIAGANGIGKSNLFDAIHFLSLTANSSLLEAALKVRDDSGHNNDIRGLFHRIGDRIADQMSFEVEMIVPRQAVDDLGQTGKAAITFLHYKLVVRLRHDASNGSNSNPLEIVEEELTHIKRGQAHAHILFPHNVREWRNKVVTGRRAGKAFISTSKTGDNTCIIKLHQDAAGRGRAYERAASALPRTVLSSATAAESPTALCVRREMQSWRLLQLEPTALRQPDEFSAWPHLESDGRHLAGNLARLTTKEDPERIYSQLTNRLSELIGSVRSVRIDRDEKRELLTLMMTGSDGTELPARALSDGTLRFLALSVLELDPETPGLICMEEPENGIHPDRIPAMLKLLQDIATDPDEPADESNPLRQVIVNTHSPSVVMAVPDDAVLLAQPCKEMQNEREFTKVQFACLPDSWRTRSESAAAIVTKGEMLSYLNPAAVIQHNMPAKRRIRRVIDHPELGLFATPQA
ncbi:MAG TPA: AAA family ATPase [Candidatus Limnocylindrales bacterium]|nr:AAA family ATPase [Candidatus Limnocylindrales bacterium]